MHKSFLRMVESNWNFQSVKCFLCEDKWEFALSVKVLILSSLIGRTKVDNIPRSTIVSYPIMLLTV